MKPDIDLDDPEARALEALDLDRLDAVQVPAARRSGRTLKFLIRKAEDVPHPNQRNGSHVPLEPDAENLLIALDAQGMKMFQRLIADIEQMKRELAELRAQAGKPNSLLTKTAPLPRSKQVQAGDGDVIVSKDAAAKSHLRMRVPFTNVVYGS